MGGGGGVDGVCVLHLAAGFLPDSRSRDGIGKDQQEGSKAEESGEAYARRTADNAAAALAHRPGRGR